MGFIVSSKSAFPKYEYTQDQVVDFLASNWSEKERLVSKFSKSVCVEKRALCLKFEDIIKLSSFAERNEIWQREAFTLAKKSIELVLESTGISLSEIDLFITTSVTGFSIPSLDALLMNRMNFSRNTKRLPLFGLGCLAGVSSLNRAYDYLKSHKKGVVLITAVELCSLTFQQEDLSMENLIGTSLFGDGAGSVIMVGSEHPLAQKAKYEVVDYEAFFYKNSEDTMGWNIRDTGFKLILNKNVSELVEQNIPQNLKQLLNKANVNREDVTFSICHPGGPKVLISMQEALELSEDDFKNSWESLRDHGNLSSASVLNVLEKSIDDNLGEKNHFGVMAAMGPGFNSEITIIKSCK